MSEISDLYSEGKKGKYMFPRLDFKILPDKAHCVISGESYLEDSASFYQTVFDWLKEFTEKKAMPIEFELKLTYFNTSSYRCFYDVLHLLKIHEDKGNHVLLRWYHEDEDDDMIEEIEDAIIPSGLSNVELIPFD